MRILNTKKPKNTVNFENAVTAYIFVGGTCRCENISLHPAEGDLLIAADSGYRNAKALGVTPNLLVGDFDSLGADELPRDIERLTVPAEKDFTDAQLAVDEAVRRGARRVFVIGGLDGRLDHTLSCLALLEELWRRGIRQATIEDGQNRVRYLSADSAILLRSGYRYLSLVAVDPVVRGVEIEGVKYPLKNAVLRRERQYAVSNEIEGNCAFVAVKKGAILIVESGD